MQLFKYAGRKQKYTIWDATQFFAEKHKADVTLVSLA